jgi:hypothetical protein
MATVASYKKLFTYYQKDGVDNHTFHREFVAHIETLETYGGVGVVGVFPLFLTAQIEELAADGLIANPANPTDAEHALAVSSVWDEFLAALMLSGANQEHFGALWIDLKNQYGYGDDCYPKTINNCLSLLNCWQPFKESQTKTPRTPCTPATPTDKDKVDDEALVFAQDSKKLAANQDDDSSSHKGSSVCSPPKTPKYRKVCCGACGELGHTSLVCPNKKPSVQVHAMSAEPDDASVCSDASSVIFIAQNHDGRSSIDPNFLLLDSQSTVNLFSNPLTSTMFAQLHIPSKFTAARELCRPTMSLILVPTKYMSTKMTSPTYSPSSCLPRNIISPMIAMIVGGCSRFTHLRA